jgi:hypothetical protein
LALQLHQENFAFLALRLPHPPETHADPALRVGKTGEARGQQKPRKRYVDYTRRSKRRGALGGTAHLDSAGWAADGARAARIALGRAVATMPKRRGRRHAAAYSVGSYGSGIAPLVRLMTRGGNS